MPFTFDHEPELRLVVDNSASIDRARDIFLHCKAFAPDPDGQAIWLLVDKPAADTPA